MSKVLVDRELLCHALSGGVKGEHARSELRGMLSRAQPAEAEGVRDYLTEFAEGEVEAKTAIEELQDALSAVTAERDRLQAELERAYANYNQVSYASTERGKQIDQLRAEVDRLRNELAGKPLVC